MKRTLFSPEHETCRDAVCAFVDAELVPHHAKCILQVASSSPATPVGQVDPQLSS